MKIISEYELLKTSKDKIAGLEKHKQQLREKEQKRKERRKVSIPKRRK